MREKLYLYKELHMYLIENVINKESPRKRYHILVLYVEKIDLSILFLSRLPKKLDY